MTLSRIPIFICGKFWLVGSLSVLDKHLTSLNLFCPPQYEGPIWPSPQACCQTQARWSQGQGLQNYTTLACLIFLFSLLPSFSPAQVIFTSYGPSEIWAGGLALISSGFPSDPLLMSLGPYAQMFWLLYLKIHCPSPVCHPNILPLLFSVGTAPPRRLSWLAK